MAQDYSKIGFKCGLEIHQQLNTGKLFCRCPSVLRSDKPEFEVKRKLHAVAGESGNVDEAVLHEAKLSKEFIYQGYNTTCLIELDEAPPEIINPEALKITMQIALLLNCEILPVTQIMRKTVIDGSNTGGFQRTVLIAQNGYVETVNGKVKIETIALEEDAARIIEKRQGEVVYRLDRLGIPLIEIATAPDIKSPEQCKEVALHLGDILRACNVKRGIGTIRQDINISIKNHPRVEIKGFQDPKMFVTTIEKEIERQLKNKSGKSEVRKAEQDGTTSFMRPMPGASRMYPETDLQLLKISREMVNETKNLIPKLRSDIKEELKSHGLNDEIIKLIINENKINDLKELLQIFDDANLIAKMLVLWPKDIAKKQNLAIEKVIKKFTIDVLEEILQALNKNKIEKNDVLDILSEIAKGKSAEDALKIEKIDVNKVEEFIVKLVKEKPGLNIGGYMGLIVKEFNNKISGKALMDILKKYVK